MIFSHEGGIPKRLAYFFPLFQLMSLLLLVPRAWRAHGMGPVADGLLWRVGAQRGNSSKRVASLEVGIIGG